MSHPSTSRQGVALVIVLGFLVLISALILAFFSTVTTELTASQTYAGSVTTKQLADTATNFVMGQISMATQSVKPGTTSFDANAALAWASQPGMIRTFDTTGQGYQYFKLYSSPQMIIDAQQAGSWDPIKELSNEVPDDWATKPSIFTDLNSPRLVPDAGANNQQTIPPEDVLIDKTYYRPTYPIVDPVAQATKGNPLTGVDGFSITNPPGGNAQNPPSAGYNPLAGGPTGNPAPMPVRWLYVLRDGKLIAPTSSNGTQAIFQGSTVVPTTTNPIVGRVAFWTDDDTCKLNVNTASEGVFWDRPWANSTDTTSPYGELQLGQRMPAQDEFQRFPGHPATTCLSTVLQMNSYYQVPTGAASMHLTTTNYTNAYQHFYTLSPRVGLNGTQAGTVANTSDSLARPMVLDQDRLFASLDELQFQAAPNYSGTLPYGERNINTGFKRSMLEKSKFFLTAYNRAPEVNLFGKPRITLWPLNQETDPNSGKGGCPTRIRNAKDDLLAFCSTVGGQPYYFQRYSIYLRELVNNRSQGGRPTDPGSGLPIPFMQLPKYGYQPPSSQYPHMDWDLVTRNQNLYSYLQDLTSRPEPGFGGSFSQKYNSRSALGATDRDQILTEMIDLARSGANVYSTALSPRYEFGPARDMPDASMGETQLVPLIPTGSANGTKGFGRFPSIAEAALLFYRVDYRAGAAPATGAATPMVRCMLLFCPVSPTSGPASWSPLIRYEVKGLNNISINGTSNLFLKGTPDPNDPTKAILTNLETSRVGYGSGDSHSTAFNGLFAQFRRWSGAGADANKHILNHDEVVGGIAYNEELDYPFVSKGITLTFPPGSSTAPVLFNGGNGIDVEVHSGYEELPSGGIPSPSTLVQSYHFDFPQFTVNMAQAPNPLVTEQTTPTGGARQAIGINTRITGGINGLVDTANDRIRSVQLDPKGPTHGDIRLLAAQLNVPSSYFAVLDKTGYATPTTPMVHSLRMGSTGRWGYTITNSALGGSALITNTYISNYPVVAPRGMNGAFNAGGLGDWDNGNGNLEDGAYINKPDDGNAISGNLSAPGGYFASGSFTTEKAAETFSPNRQVSSAVMFGSLPSRVFANRPWETLVFCPNPAAGNQHPSFSGGPKDHLLLDLFTMPIVEPYAVSEPFSTAGKVNLNYQIVPFTYISRTAPLRGVLKSVKIMSIPTTSAGNYKSGAGATLFRRNIDLDETIKGFDDRFNNGGFFRSASEICDMFLVPTGTSWSTTLNANYWGKMQLTGDNAREIPYGHIYPRVTTKSNSYTVHMRVEVLKKNPSSTPTVWDEAKDQVVADYRGSSQVERYVDPAAPELTNVDFIAQKGTTLDQYYRFRVVGSKRFAPQ